MGKTENRKNKDEVRLVLKFGSEAQMMGFVDTLSLPDTIGVFRADGLDVGRGSTEYYIISQKDERRPDMEVK